MANARSIASDRFLTGLIYAFALTIPTSIFAAFYYDIIFLAGIPAVLLLVYWCIVDFKKVFFLLLFCLPLSMEISLPGGFATDLPTEPLMVGLMLVYLFYLASKSKTMSASFLKHPLSLLVLLHFFWIFACTIYAETLFVSVKFTLAKFWYIIVFYFLAGSLLKKEKDIRTFFWCVSLPLLFTVTIILIRHALRDFAFDEINGVMYPFYRNHVNYASLLGLFVPFVWYMRKGYKTFSKKWWFLAVSLIILVLGIQFSFTRAVYLALLVAIAANYAIRLRLMKVAMTFALASVIAGVIYFSTNNQYLDYAPEFEKTVAHTQFDNLVEATAKGEDVSLMERFYRWIAGAYMVVDKPVFGFGPGNFYHHYRPYTVRSFETYVSNNPEQSGIHSYYLMTAVEQGIPGVLIFLLLNVYFIIFGEKVFHQTRDIFKKRMVMAILLSVITINTLLLINDLIETDKIGAFFFIALAILVNIDISNKQKIAA